MINNGLKESIQEIKSSIVAIGFTPNPQQITIIGSGFSVSDDGKILTAAHIYNQLKEEQRTSLQAFVMVERIKDDFERYKWIPMKLIGKNDSDDLALFKLAEYKNTLLKKILLVDSDEVKVGQDTYFIGFPYAAQLINDGFGVTLIVNKAIISNVKRDGSSPDHKRNWFILDAISNPGNSGCPLIDLETGGAIGVMTISFRMGSKVQKDLDIREPMHICAAKPANLAKLLI